MKKLLCVLLLAIVVAIAPAALADEGQSEKKKDDTAEKRQNIDSMAQEALDQVLEESANAKSLYEKAHGWAVFDNLKVALGISGGAGSGVAVNKASGKRTYMKMGTGGVGLGLGGQKYQVVFFFENEQAFNNFVDKGWKAEAGAQAAAGTEGANVATGFSNGMAIYQITDKGLMASADVSGTKYWKNDKLNK